ncbi:hypothetical protein Pelo_18074 [Pelomyxa schiedti]|nr:hypothetical protein Pelo_18074 [Pelomyxa schiedti]
MSSAPQLSISPQCPPIIPEASTSPTTSTTPPPSSTSPSSKTFPVAPIAIPSSSRTIIASASLLVSPRISPPLSRTTSVTSNIALSVVSQTPASTTPPSTSPTSAAALISSGSTSSISGIVIRPLLNLGNTMEGTPRINKPENTPRVVESTPRPKAFSRNTLQRLTFSLTVYKTSLLTIKFLSGINIRGQKGKPISAFCTVTVIDPQAVPQGTIRKQKANKTDCVSEGNTWNEDIPTEISSTAETVRIEVKGHRKLQKDELVGTIDIPVYRLHDFNTPTVLPIQPVKDSKASGEIEIVCTFVTALERNEDLRITRLYYDTLYSILIEPELLMIIPICTSLQKKCDDSMGIALVRLFNKENLALPFVVTMLSEEISRGLQYVATLLRGDTVSTRLCANYCKYIGYRYLVNTIVPHVEFILDNTSHYEVDPVLASPEDNLQENAANLVSICTNIVNSIVASVATIPRYLSFP